MGGFVTELSVRVDWCRRRVPVQVTPDPARLGAHYPVEWVCLPGNKIVY